jgi:hypothetical protein
MVIQKTLVAGTHPEEEPTQSANHELILDGRENCDGGTSEPLLLVKANHVLRFQWKDDSQGLPVRRVDAVVIRRGSEAWSPTGISLEHHRPH